MPRFDTKSKVLMVVVLEAILVLVAGLLILFAYLNGYSPQTSLSQINVGTSQLDLLRYAIIVQLFAFGGIVGVMVPLLRRSQDETTNISNLAKSFEKQAVTDALTELPNRRYFEGAFEAYLKEFNSLDQSFGLMVLDLDYFKSVNDNHGHDIGDLVLREVALRLSAITREHDIVARLGGEEFAVITPFASHSQLLAIAERYRANIESLKVDIGKVILRPTISIGVATNESRKIGRAHV